MENKIKSPIIKSPRRIRDTQKSESFITSWDLELFGKLSEKELKILECWRSNHRLVKYGNLSVGNGMTSEDLQKFFKCNIKKELNLILKKGYLILKEDNKLYCQNCRKVSGEAGYGFLLSKDTWSPTITASTITENAVIQPKINQLNNPIHSNDRLYGEDGISPALNTAQGGNRQPKIISKVRAILTPNRENKRQNGRKFKEDGEPSFTLTRQDIHRVSITYPTLSTELAHSTGRDFFRNGGQKMYECGQIRRLTPVECCRLQGFPDDWNEFGIDKEGNKVKMSDTQRYKQIGNAVTTNVITSIGNKLQ